MSVRIVVLYTVCVCVCVCVCVVLVMLGLNYQFCIKERVFNFHGFRHTIGIQKQVEGNTYYALF